MPLADLDILIVDDHEGMRTLLLKVLNRAGVQKLRAAASGFEALTSLGHKRADLVLLDQTMPGMDGMALTEAIRSDGSLKDIRLIMITGNAAAADAQAALKAGANAVLVKPVAPRALLEAIENVMGA